MDRRVYRLPEAWSNKVRQPASAGCRKSCGKTEGRGYSSEVDSSGESSRARYSAAFSGLPQAL